MNEGSDDTTDDETYSLFDENEDGTDDTDGTEVLTDESDSDADDAWLFDDVCKRPPEYYLAEGASLDVNCLRQQRYSPKTQDRLDWVKEHWHR